MNATLSPDTTEAITIAQEIVTVRSQIDELVREHDAMLAAVLDGFREGPTVQVNFGKLLDVISRQSDLLHLLDQRLRLMEDAIEPDIDVVWAVGAD